MTSYVDDNLFPKVILVEGTSPSSPSAGEQKLFIDSADHLLKRVDSSGTVSTIGGGGGGLKQVVADVYQSGDNANVTHVTTFGAYPNTPTLTITTVAANDVLRFALDTFCNSGVAGATVQFRVKLVGAGAGGTQHATFATFNLNGTVQALHMTADSPALAVDTYTCTLEFLTATSGFYVRVATASTGEYLSVGAFEYHN